MKKRPQIVPKILVASQHIDRFDICDQTIWTQRQHDDLNGLICADSASIHLYRMEVSMATRRS